ncbi:phage portal protein [Companilactobacillus mishanensis]|uniref:phage portal protein n=1 Tax=Companilactobacillus mishanensis TaxID=2486008 RepID=UPI001EE16F25|nr:phage portal protein [Companilactobacillus mishanensis]
MGTRKSLSKITDDSRIDMDVNEYIRIDRDFKYYANNYPKKQYIDAEGARRERAYNTINIAKRASKRIASIVFNEQCKISFEDKTLGDFLNQVLDDNDFKNQFEENLEKGIVAGGFAMRPYVSNGKIKIAWIRADQFYPLRSNTNSISEAAIASRSTTTENNENVYYTLLEFHEWKQDNYVITNELYRSTEPSIIGMQVDLADLYPDIEPVIIINGAKMVHPLFSYFRMPGANNISLESPLGVGIVDNTKHTIDDLNLTHDSFMWEIRNGKRTIAVPESMLKFDPPQKGVKRAHRPMFDTDTDVYVQMMGESDIQIKDLTSSIRVQEFTDSMNAFLREFESDIGMAPGTFSYDSKTGFQTATQVVSENSMTYQTRSSILTNVTACIEDLCEAILELASVPEFFTDGVAQFSLDNVENLNDLGMSIKYDDGVFVDKDKRMDEDLKNVVAGTLSKLTYLQRNYGMSEKDAKAELQRIQDETPQADTIAGNESSMFGGGDGD